MTDQIYEEPLTCIARNVEGKTEENSSPLPYFLTTKSEVLMAKELAFNNSEITNRELHLLFNILQGLRPYGTTSNFRTVHKSERGGKKGEYDFVPSTPNYIHWVLDVIAELNFDRNSTIVDLGCGISPLLIYLRHLGFRNLYGIDNDKQYITTLQKILCTDNDHIVHGNLMDKNLLDKWIISDADVLYSYMPMSNYEQYSLFIKTIWKMMSPGAVLIDYYGPINEFIDSSHLCQGLFGTYMKT